MCPSALKDRDERLLGRYTINEMSNMYNVSFPTLRLYEEKELIRPLRIRTARYFSEQDRVRLELILKGKKLGFSLASIWEIIEAHNQSGRTGADDFSKALSEAEIEEQIDRLMKQRASIDEALEELRHADSQLNTGVR